jgi:hypothetical protein
MKYLKSLRLFESFGMQRDNCDRCKGPTDNKTTHSMFNEQVICMKCKEDEIKDPEYDAACKADQEAYLSGERNFKGALPDYKPLERN